MSDITEEWLGHREGSGVALAVPKGCCRKDLHLEKKSMGRVYSPRDATSQQPLLCLEHSPLNLNPTCHSLPPFPSLWGSERKCGRRACFLRVGVFNVWRMELSGSDLTLTFLLSHFSHPPARSQPTQNATHTPFPLPFAIPIFHARERLHSMTNQNPILIRDIYMHIYIHTYVHLLFFGLCGRGSD
jgi:hypothetical protein